MKNKLKSAISLLLCFAVLFSGMAIASSASGVPETEYFKDDFSSGINLWDPVSKSMNRSDCTVSSVQASPYSYAAGFSSDALVLSPKKSSVNSDLTVYSVSYTLKSNTSDLTESSSLKIYTDYKSDSDYSAYELYKSDSSVTVNAVKKSNGSREVKKTESVSGISLTDWFTAKISAGGITLIQGDVTKTVYNTSNSVKILISGKKALFAKVESSSIDRESMSFTDSKDYFEAVKGFVKDVKISSEADGNALSFTEDYTYIKAKDELLKGESGDLIQTIRMQVKTNSTKPIEIYTSYEDEKNYNYLYIVQGPQTSYMTFYGVTNGTKKSLWAQSQIPVSSINFYKYADVFVNLTESGKVQVKIYQNGTNPKISFTVNSITTQAKELVIGSMAKNTTVYKNLKISLANPDNFTSVYKETKRFNAKYDELYRIDSQSYTKNYDSVINSFESDYQKLSAASRNYIYEKKMHVDYLKSISSSAPAAVKDKTKDLSDFTDNFENGLSNWVDATNLDCDRLTYKFNHIRLWKGEL